MVWSRSYLIEPPTEPVATVEEIEAILGITPGSVPSIEPMAQAVTDVLDIASGGRLGRALRPQTWEFRLSAFYSCGAIRLPYPTVIEVPSIKYDDGSGVEQTLAPADYRVFGLGDKWCTEVVPAYGITWPTARTDREAIRIRYVAGYPKEVGPPAKDHMPTVIKTAVAMGVQQLYASSRSDPPLVMEEIPGVMTLRWATVSADTRKAIASSLSEMLENYRVKFV